jgi:hypothetical protein
MNTPPIGHNSEPKYKAAESNTPTNPTTKKTYSIAQKIFEGIGLVLLNFVTGGFINLDLLREKSWLRQEYDAVFTTAQKSGVFFQKKTEDSEPPIHAKDSSDEKNLHGESNQAKGPEAPINVKAANPDIQPSVITLTAIASEVFNERDTLWEEAFSEAKEMNIILDLFIQKIRAKFSQNGRSLSEVSKNPEARSILCQSARVKIALEMYEQMNGISPPSPGSPQSPLCQLAQSILENRADYYKLAESKSGGNPAKTLILMTLLIRKAFQEKNSSLSEVLNDKDALAIFKKSNTLQLILQIYIEMKRAEDQVPTEQNDFVDPDKRGKEEAVRLGKQHAQGIGFVTQLGMKDYAGDKTALQGKIKQFLRENHPDKKPDADVDQVKAATQLLQMIGRGDYEQYRKIIDRHREM